MADNSNSKATRLKTFVSVTGKGTIDPEMKNFAADPFFVKKEEEAKAEIDLVGLPKKKSKTYLTGYFYYSAPYHLTYENQHKILSNSYLHYILRSNFILFLYF